MMDSTRDGHPVGEGRFEADPILHRISAGRIHAAFTGRTGGCSRPPFGTANLATHVGDDVRSVERNRATVSKILGIQPEWCVVSQIHGNSVVGAKAGECGQADAIVGTSPGTPAAIFTADCLPILLVGTSGTSFAVVHAGWRGIAGGVIEAAGSALEATGCEIGAIYIGPSIGPCCYEVSRDLADEFEGRFGPGVVVPGAANPRLDLKRAAASIVDGFWPGTSLSALGPCTHSADLFSYRVDGPETGRQALVAWIE